MTDGRDSGRGLEEAPPDRSESSARLLVHDWLVPPAVEQEPPLAVPLALAVDAGRRRMLILEAVPPEVRVYDLDSGRLLRRLGRQGDGPGEYRHPRALAMSETGITAVLSLSGRLTFWSPDFHPLATLSGGRGMGGDVLAAIGDTFIVKTDVFPPDDVSKFHHVTLSGVAPEPFYRDDGLPSIGQAGLPFRDHTYAVGTTLEGELLLAPPGPDYVILSIDRGGQVRERSERRDLGPLHRSDAEVAELREAVSQGFASSGRAAPERIPIPPYRPHVRRLARSPDGRIWALTGRGADSEAVIDVFEAEGAFLESYRFDLAVLDLALTRRAIYLLGQGSSGLPGVAVAARPDLEGPSRSE